MLIYTERVRKNYRKIAGVLDVTDLDSFADQIIEDLAETIDGRITILKVDKEGSVFPKRKWWKLWR